MKSIEISTRTNNSKGELEIKNIDQIDWFDETKLYALGFPCNEDPLPDSPDTYILFFDINNEKSRERLNLFMKNILKKKDILFDKHKNIEQDLNDLFIARKNCNVYEEFTAFTDAIYDTKESLESVNEEIKSLKDLYNFFSAPWSYLIANHNIDEPRIIKVILNR